MEGAHLIKFWFKGKGLERTFITSSTLVATILVGMNVFTTNLLTLHPGTVDIVV